MLTQWLSKTFSNVVQALISSSDANGNPQAVCQAQPLPVANGAADAFAVTPSDSVALMVPAQCLYVGVAGTVTVVTLSGQTVEFMAVAAGSIIPLAVAKVKATGTSATNIVALTAIPL